MSSPLWMVALIVKSFSQIFTLAKLTNTPVIGKLIDYALFNNDNIMYLPQNQVVPIGKSLKPIDQLPVPSQVVEHFILETNFHWIMNSCICRRASGCRDYPVDLGCLFLGKAAMGINPKLGRRVEAQEALEHVARCRAEGLVHLIGRNKLDAAWLNVRPGNRLLTICNCCPCCCLWRILPVITPDIGHKVTPMPGISVSVTDRCLGCGACTEDVCFVNAIRLEGNQAIVQPDCRGCGRCVNVCPNNAIELTIQNPEYVGAAIDRISKAVDVG